LGSYLQSTAVIDWREPEIGRRSESLCAGAASGIERARRLYEWVRDEIAHSADAGHDRVTCRASDVLRFRTGLCYAKAHLLAALLRAAGIPAGFCYQVLRCDDASPRLALHGLSGVYLADLGHWVRLDPRGNKPGIDAQFAIDEERLAFAVDTARGEQDCLTVFAHPLPVVLNTLASGCTVTRLMASLPDRIDAGDGPSTPGEGRA
jgi:transglutaminase-like putative cysteine protease